LYRIPTDARLNHEVTVISGVLEQRCAQLLKTFFRQKRDRVKQRARCA
jgi:tRNA(adenine34) deaminase